MTPGVDNTWQLLFWTAFLLLICRNDFSIIFQFAMFVDLQIGGLSAPYNFPLNHCCCQPESDPVFPLTFVILYCWHGLTTTLNSICVLYFESTVELWGNHIVHFGGFAAQHPAVWWQWSELWEHQSLLQIIVMWRWQHSDHCYRLPGSVSDHTDSSHRFQSPLLHILQFLDRRLLLFVHQPSQGFFSTGVLTFFMHLSMIPQRSMKLSLTD